MTTLECRLSPYITCTMPGKEVDAEQFVQDLTKEQGFFARWTPGTTPPCLEKNYAVSIKPDGNGKSIYTVMQEEQPGVVFSSLFRPSDQSLVDNARNLALFFKNKFPSLTGLDEKGTNALLRNVEVLRKVTLKSASTGVKPQVDGHFQAAKNAIEGGKSERAFQRFLTQREGVQSQKILNPTEFYAAFGHRRNIWNLTRQFNRQVTVIKPSHGDFETYLGSKSWLPKWTRIFSSPAPYEKKYATLTNLVEMFKAHPPMYAVASEGRKEVEGMLANLEELKANILHNTTPSEEVELIKLIQVIEDQLYTSLFQLKLAEQRGNTTLSRVGEVGMGTLAGGGLVAGVYGASSIYSAISAMPPFEKGLLGAELAFGVGAALYGWRLYNGGWLPKSAEKPSVTGGS